VAATAHAAKEAAAAALEGSARREWRPLDLLLPWINFVLERSPPLGDGSQGGGQFVAMDGASEIYSVGGFTGAIRSKLLDLRALGNL
jgi:hypothetical protein